jgi:hypothetical protein
VEGREKNLEGERVGRGDGPFPFAVARLVKEDREKKRETHIEIALDAETDTTLETVSGMLVVVEVFVFSPQSKPRAAQPISSGRFVVSEWLLGRIGGWDRKEAASWRTSFFIGTFCCLLSSTLLPLPLDAR